jgi:hypothetical protein
LKLGALACVCNLSVKNQKNIVISGAQQSKGGNNKADGLIMFMFNAKCVMLISRSSLIFAAAVKPTLLQLTPSHYVLLKSIPHANQWQ